MHFRKGMSRGKMAGMRTRGGRAIPMSAPWITAADVAAVSRVVRSGRLALGPATAAFEAAVARVAGTRHAIAVSSGTAGLHLAVRAAGIRPGDDVVTTPLSFVASCNAFVQEGARPRFVDVDPATLMPRPLDLVSAVSRRTRAILTVDLFGDPFDADPVLAFARRRGLAVIEDACEALGSTYKGRPAGSLGDAAVFGFYPNKQITTGEGGMITTSRREWDALLRSLRNQGRDIHDAWTDHSRLGFNYRLDEMSAALGVSQLRRLDAIVRERARVASLYSARIAAIGGVDAPRSLPTTTRISWFVYVVRLAPGIDRDRVMRDLEARGVPSRAYFSPIHLQKPYRDRFGFRPGEFPVAEAMSRRCLALPFHARMHERDVEHVCRALSAVIARGASARRR